MSASKNTLIRRLIICLLIIATIGVVFSETIWKDSESPTSISSDNTLNTGDQDDQRLLRLENGKLVVYDGENNMLNTLDIDAAILPETWQNQLRDGGISFANEEALFSALDSLDEYDQ